MLKKEKRNIPFFSALLKRMEKNCRNGVFFSNERKRTDRTERFFQKNGKELTERNVLFKRTGAHPCEKAPANNCVNEK